MKLNDILYKRQYRIALLSEPKTFEKAAVDSWGIWQHPRKDVYILTLTSVQDRNNDPAEFKSSFLAATGLSASSVKMDPTYGPFTPQRAVDKPWF